MKLPFPMGLQTSCYEVQVLESPQTNFSSNWKKSEKYKRQEEITMKETTEQFGYFQDKRSGYESVFKQRISYRPTV